MSFTCIFLIVLMPRGCSGGQLTGNAFSAFYDDGDQIIIKNRQYMEVNPRDVPIYYNDSKMTCTDCLPIQMCDPGLSFRLNSNSDYNYWHYLDASEPNYQQDLDALMPGRTLTLATCGILDGNLTIKPTVQYPWKYASYSPYLSMDMKFDQIYNNDYQYISGYCMIDVDPIATHSHHAGMDRKLVFRGGVWSGMPGHTVEVYLSPGDHCWSLTLNMTHCRFRMRDIDISVPNPFPDKVYNPDQPLRVGVRTPYTSSSWFSGCDWHMYYTYIGPGEDFPPRFQTRRGKGEVRLGAVDYPGPLHFRHKYWDIPMGQIAVLRWENAQWSSGYYTIYANFNPAYIGCVQESVTAHDNLYIHKGQYIVHPALGEGACAYVDGWALACEYNISWPQLMCADARLCRAQTDLTLIVEDLMVVSVYPRIDQLSWSNLPNKTIMGPANCTAIQSDIHLSQVLPGTVDHRDDCGNQVAGTYTYVCNHTHVSDQEFIMDADCISVSIPVIPECEAYLGIVRGDLYQFDESSLNALCRARPGCHADALACGKTHTLCTPDRNMVGVLSICTPLQVACIRWTITREPNATVFLPDPSAVSAALGGIVAIVVLIILCSVSQIALILWYARSRFCRPCRRSFLERIKSVRRASLTRRGGPGSDRFSVRRYLRRTHHPDPLYNANSATAHNRSASATDLTV